MASEIEYRATFMVYWFLTQISIKVAKKKIKSTNNSLLIKSTTNSDEIIEYIYEKNEPLSLYKAVHNSNLPCT